MEWFEYTMHIACFHLVVTPLVSINQPWWVFHHQVCVVEHLVHVLWWFWLHLKHVTTKVDDVSCLFYNAITLTERMKHTINTI